MRKLFLILLIMVLLVGCNPSTTQEDPTQSPAPQATPTQPATDVSPSQETDAGADLPDLMIPDPVPAFQVAEPSELHLNGSMNWIWETSLPKANSLATMYSMCAAVAGEDELGKEAVYVSDVYAFSQQPAYVAGEEYPHISSVTGTKFSVYFIEHNGTHWRLMYLPMDSPAEEALVIDEGSGLIPTLSPHEQSLVYMAQDKDAYELRIWQKAWDGDIITELQGTIPMDKAPLEMERQYQFNEHGVTYTQAIGGHFVVVNQAPGEEPVLIDMGASQPFDAQWAGDSLCWLNESGELFLYNSQSHTTWTLGEKIRWFRQDERGSLILFGGESGLFVASLMDNGDMGVVPLAQGAWQYIDGNYYELGEGYVCVIRQKDGVYQFIGMELILPSGE